VFITDTRTIDLVDEVPDADDKTPLRIAFIGPYNAGKSSLISALTGDLSISRDSKPETSEVSYHPWRGALLGDMPGWFSGFQAHDAAADTALKSQADLVAFTMTVELGGQDVRDALERVLGYLAFEQRAILIINKKNAEDSDPAVIAEEVRSRLGRHASVPVVFTDAQDVLDTITPELSLSDRTRDVLRKSSGLPDLEEALERLIWENSNARDDAQRHQALRLIGEGRNRWSIDPEEAAGRALVLDLRAHGDRCRKRLAEAFKAESSWVTTELSQLAVRIVDARATGGPSDADYAATEQAWGELADECDRRLNETFEAEFDALATATSATFDVLPLDALHAVPSPRRDEPAASAPSLLRRMISAVDLKPGQVLKPVDKALEGVAKGGHRQGSRAYDLARKLQPNKVFRPHERLKDAEKIKRVAKDAGKVSKALPLAIPVFLEGRQWWRDRQRANAEKDWAKTVRRDFQQAADEHGQALAEQFQEWLRGAFVPFNEQVEVLEAPLLELEADRRRATSTFDLLQAEFAAGAENAVYRDGPEAQRE